MQRAVAIVPCKGCATGKSRLAAVLPGEVREGLILRMLQQVVLAARAAGLDVWVVGGDQPVVSLCGRMGAAWLPEGGGLNPSVRAALACAFQEGFDTAVVLASDLPLATAADVNEVLALLRAPKTAVLVPSPDGGTNALAAPLPFPFEPAFGPRSFQRHRRLATEAGLATAVCRTAGLVRDVDVPGDLVRVPGRRWRSCPGLERDLHPVRRR